MINKELHEVAIEHLMDQYRMSLDEFLQIEGAHDLLKSHEDENNSWEDSNIVKSEIDDFMRTESMSKRKKMLKSMGI